MPVITLNKLTKRYQSSEVIHQIDLVMEDNEFTVFVGPSGCGKSTTLRMIAGLETVSDGEIKMDDRSISNLEPIDRDIAMVFQDYALYPHMDVYKNMSFALRLAKHPKSDIKKRVTEAAEMLGLTEYLHRKPAELSGGQRQRVAMGRALVRNSSTLLMDEPLSNLDAKLRGQMRAELAMMSKNIKKNIIYVTHDQIEAMTLADRIVVMKDGYIQQHGTPRELFEKPSNKFVAGFMGMPPMNFLNMTVEEENGTLYAVGESFKLQLPKLDNLSFLPESGEIIVGIRPSALIPTDPGESQNTITFKINVNEYIGNQTVLISTIQESRFMVEVDSLNEFRIGDTVSFKVDPDDIYVFDKHTEETIY
ncbi:ABC transporter ATP-binding protein [Vibrio nigripulchritudo]|uniref:ABC transporter ATP-binding protein n=1 Tax=Vibrio nigripulchritudo TaxID=28173 RepID=UPI0024902DC7|nr:ABC transporter ATP-binding protein [Vibrio nigripulchritudo]BDU37004.1 sugar ABC transporter ATP-binding protein [Vibrio nigripulchritudo]BDU42714.1 sugar ABC transporter ATP-binding protein [Vibrio nigripulchritudo]